MEMRKNIKKIKNSKKDENYKIKIKARINTKRMEVTKFIKNEINGEKGLQTHPANQHPSNPS